MLFPNAPRSIKFASGENPKRVYGSRDQLPSTRMGNFEVQRQALVEAQEYIREWDTYNDKVKRGDKDVTPPKRDLKLDALADVLRGKLMVQIHCYRADEMLTEIAMAKEFGYNLRAFHHAVEAYKVADQLAANNVAIATWADWWGFKQEAWDAIPWNAVISMRKGVRVAIKSDSEDYTRRLNQDAAKIMRYGGATEEEALKMITLNAAWIVGVDDRVGSIDVGKDADLVIWDGYPLSSTASPKKSSSTATSTSTALDPASAPPTTRRENNAGVSPQHSAFSTQKGPAERALLSAGVDSDLGIDFLYAVDARFYPGPTRSPQRRQTPYHHPRSNRKRHSRHARRKNHRRRRSQVCQPPSRSPSNRRHRNDHLPRPHRFRNSSRPHRNRSRSHDQRSSRAKRRDHAPHAHG